MIDRKIIAGFFILIAIVAISYIVLLKRKEGFTLSNQFPIYGSYSNNRPAYIDESQRKYNKFSDTMDIRRGNYIGSFDEKVIQVAQSSLNQATRINEVGPSTKTHTLFDIIPVNTKARLSAPNKVYENTQLCESLTGRNSCAALDDPKYGNCGVCLKGGIPFTKDVKDHIGGLLLLPDHRDEQRDNTPPGQTPQYNPSIGECPGGWFVADKATCEKAKNRLNCLEAGENGGFDIGKTNEGEDVIPTSCAYVPSANGNLYVYEPKYPVARSFGVNLRGIVPVGSGKCKIYVYTADNQKKQVGFVESISPGTEFIVPIEGVKEGDVLSVYVVLEAAYCSGKQEVYLVDTGGDQTQSTSAAVCPRMNARQATKDQLINAFQNGSQVYQSGWTSDGFLGFILQKSDPAYGVKGLNQDTSTFGNTWCYGTRIPDSKNKVYKTTIQPFYKTADTGMTVRSQYGVDYQGACTRGIILQWENKEGSSVRTIQFQPTILGVDGIPIGQAITDGKATMKKLRIMGSFGNSKEILAPKPNRLTTIQSNANWIWSNISDSQTVTFDVKVPSTFKDTFYPEDMPLASRGPLIGNKASLDLLKVLPCDQQGQLPGKYSKTCLEYIFSANGGNILKGKIALEDGGIMQLNELGDQDSINYYLKNLYSTATTGRDLEGVVAGSTPDTLRDGINRAATLLFGFNIASPCENIREDDEGNMLIITKSRPYPEQCLAFLWENSLSQYERGVNDKDLTVKNTYTSIGERYSGLKKREGTVALQKQYPFQTCTLNGALSPLSPTGEVNKEAVAKANSIGDITKIQDYYNSIYQKANSSVTFNAGNPKATVDASFDQAEAIKNCYGVKKSFQTLPAPDYKLQLTQLEGFGNPESFDQYPIINGPNENAQTANKNTVEGFWSPGYGFWEGWADKLAHAWADGNNVGGGLRSAIPNGTKLIMRINSLDIGSFPDIKCPGFFKDYSKTGCGPDAKFKPKPKYVYLRYNPSTNMAEFVKDYNSQDCVFTLVHPQETDQFKKWCEPRNNMGLEPRRYMFGLKPMTQEVYFTFKGADAQCNFEQAKWPNNQPGPTQMFNWNDVSGYSNPRYPYGPYCYGGWGMVYNIDGKAMGRGNYSLNQTMELIPVIFGEKMIEIVE